MASSWKGTAFLVRKCNGSAKRGVVKREGLKPAGAVHGHSAICSDLMFPIRFSAHVAKILRQGFAARREARGSQH